MEAESDHRYCVHIWRRDIGKRRGYGVSSVSMPEAICIAALRACGIEVEV